MKAPLFLEDAYRREAPGQVLSVSDAGISLDASLFYATSGGQPGDTGVLRWEDGEMAVATTRKAQDGDALLIPAENATIPPVGAHERTLQRLFVTETGTTFGRWRTQLRLQHGIVALTHGHTVTSAATLSGYQEPSAFIAAFRATFGTTPAHYLATSQP